MSPLVTGYWSSALAALPHVGLPAIGCGLNALSVGCGMGYPQVLHGVCGVGMRKVRVQYSVHQPTTPVHELTPFP